MLEGDTWMSVCLSLLNSYPLIVALLILFFNPQNSVFLFAFEVMPQHKCLEFIGGIT